MLSNTFSRFKELIMNGAYDDAIVLAEKEALTDKSGSGFWYSQLATAYLKKRQFDKARFAAEKSLALQPDNPWAMLALGESLMILGEVEKALDVFDLAYSSGKDKRAELKAKNKLCECLLRMKDWNRLMSAVAAGGLSESEQLRFEAHALHGLGEDGKARDICERWLKISPDNKSALWLMTDIDIEHEGLEAVRERMGRLSKIPSRPPVYAQIYASLCRRSGNTTTAVEQYEKLQSRGDTKQAVRQKAFILAKSGRETEALPLMEELLRSDQADHWLHSAYIAACVRKDEVTRAKLFYEQLLADNPSEKRLYGRLRMLEKKTKKEH